MAKLSAHGNEIGRIEYLTYAKAYMSDGTILKNNYGQWKVAARVKPHVDPEQHYHKKVAEHQAHLEHNPRLAAYREQLHSMTTRANRAYLHNAVQLMPEDPDGLWSEMGPDTYLSYRVNRPFSDFSRLCQLYREIGEVTRANTPVAA